MASYKSPGGPEPAHGWGLLIIDPLCNMRAGLSRIAPNVDAERDLLTGDLPRSGRVRQDGWPESRVWSGGQTLTVACMRASLIAPGGHMEKRIVAECTGRATITGWYVDEIAVKSCGFVLRFLACLGGSLTMLSGGAVERLIPTRFLHRVGPRPFYLGFFRLRHGVTFLDFRKT